MRSNNIWIIVVPEEEDNTKSMKNIWGDYSRNLPKTGKELVTQVQGVQRVP